MVFLDWDEQYTTNVQKFDNDHKQLFIIFNGVYNQIFECESLEDERKLTKETLFDLLEYTKEHFTAEEEMMVKFSYTEYDEHKQEHDNFIIEVNKLLVQYNQGIVALSFPMFMLLKEWILNHIMVCDKKYGEFFNEKGVK